MAQIYEVQREHQESPTQRAKSFHARFVDAHPEMGALLAEGQNNTLTTFFKNFEQGKFWQVMTLIQGDPDYTYYEQPPMIIVQPAPEQDRRERREWAQATFTGDELGEIFDIYMDQALHGTTLTNTTHGHAIAYEQIIDTPDSMFADRVSPELRIMLLNRMFWEELPDARIGINGRHSLNALRAILDEHFDELDLSYAPDGLRHISNETRGFTGLFLDIGYLPDQTIDRYLEFVKKLDVQRDQLGLSQETIANLVKPYINAIIGGHPEDDEAYRFERHYNPDTNEMEDPEKDTWDRFNDPFVQEYLGLEPLRVFMTKELRGMNDFQSGERAAEFLAHMPNPDGMFQRIVMDYSLEDARIAVLEKRYKEIASTANPQK